LEAARERDLAAARDDPEDTRARLDLAGVDYDLGTARENLQDFAGAREAYREVMHTLDELLERDRTNLVWLRHRSAALFRRSVSDWESGQRKAGEQEARRALALALQLADSRAASAEDFQRAAEDLIEARPDVLGSPAKALQYAQRAVDISGGANPAFLLTLA